MPQDNQVAPPLPPAQRPLGQGAGVTRSFASLRAVGALMLREMATRYGKSPGGFIWALIEPLGMIMIMAAAFSLLMRSPPLGNNFLLFYASGFLPFTLYNNVSGVVAASMNFSRPLLLYPAVTWIDAVLARFTLNTLSTILVMIVLLFAILNFTESRALITPAPIVQGCFLALLVAAGVGTLNCALFGLFPLWAQFWGIVTRPLVLASNVIFLYEGMPAAAQKFLWYNPLVHIVAHARTGIFPTYRPDYVDLTYAFNFGLITLFFGILLMGRYHRDILNN